jgi:uncharacterized protein (TIGR02145 family)
MKTLTTFILTLFIVANLSAQAPQAFKYQAVARNSSGEVLVKKPVTFRISILQGSTTGTQVYSELHSKTTNEFGLVEMEIGKGTSPSGSFTSISWGAGTYFVKVEMDPAGGIAYQTMGTSQLLSVPFALYAETANDLTTKAYVDELMEFISNELLDLGRNGMLRDIEGNTYKTIKIGNQIWMAENLKTTKYNDGTALIEVTDRDIWQIYHYNTYCWYNNDKGTNGNTYGALYKWYAVNTGKLCPAGWHVPSDAEWTILIDFLGGDEDDGIKMKETGTTHWNCSGYIYATNESGFSGLPGGERSSSGNFGDIGKFGNWWSSKGYATTAFYLSLGCAGIAYYSSDYKENGFSVRCIKD